VSPAPAFAADASLTSAVRGPGGGTLAGIGGSPLLSPGLSGPSSQSPLTALARQAAQSPLFGQASQGGQSPLAALSSQSPLAGQTPPSGRPAPHATPVQQSPSAAPSATPSATASPQPTRSQPPAQPYNFYDSVTPEAIPAGQIVATYSTGARPVPASEVAGRRRVLWIDTLATDPAGSNALDIEPGCASPSQAANWVYRRLTAEPHATAILYTMMSDWSTVQADVSTLPAWMRARIRWWIADPTGTPHIVPGSQATQWYWGTSYDESTALPGF
jgi:hypothetical protein